MAVAGAIVARARRTVGRGWLAAAAAFAAMLLIAAAAMPAAATSKPMPLFEQTDRERFEALVNASDVVCDARLDSTSDATGVRRAFFSGLGMWKGDSAISRFEETGWDFFGGDQHLDDPVPGARYRLFLSHIPRQRPGDPRDREGPPLYAVIASRTAPASPWWWAFSRATVDTIVARARLDTLFAQAPLIVLGRRVGRVKHDRDGQPVLCSRVRIERVLKGVAPADTIVYQAPDDYRHWDRALLFLEPHETGAWELVWPGAGFHSFDWQDRETRTGEPLQSFLEKLDRVKERTERH